MTWEDVDEICMRFDNCKSCPYYNATKKECEIRLQVEKDDKGDFNEL